MIVAIHQPSYFPWLGLLHKIYKSDYFILMDEVQLADRAYQHRNLFLSIQGKAHYLTIPFHKTGYRDKKIKDLLVYGNGWQKSHEKFIRYNYKHSAYFDEIYGKLEAFYSKEYHFLLDALKESMRISMDFFNIKTKLVQQSELNYNTDSKKSDLILALVKSVGGNIYLSGTGAKDYLKDEDFETAQISLIFNTFSHPVYQQINSKEFIPGLACLDVLFSLGIEKSRTLLGLI
ncbi:MAG: WbqC family protein [Dissulfurispiraceae bacterium]